MVVSIYYLAVSLHDYWTNFVECAPCPWIKPSRGSFGLLCSPGQSYSSLPFGSSADHRALSHQNILITQWSKPLSLVSLLYFFIPDLPWQTNVKWKAMGGKIFTLSSHQKVYGIVKTVMTRWLWVFVTNQLCDKARLLSLRTSVFSSVRYELWWEKSLKILLGLKVCKMIWFHLAFMPLHLMCPIFSTKRPGTCSLPGPFWIHAKISKISLNSRILNMFHWEHLPHSSSRKRLYLKRNKTPAIKT